MLYIFDIDGTLADLSHRLHHIEKTPKDWGSFHEACVDDKLIVPVAEVLRALHPTNTVVFSTARPHSTFEATWNWLTTNGLAWEATDNLYMRKSTDHRHAGIIKSENLDRILLRLPLPLSDIIAFEDHTPVVEMYRARGIRTFQVDRGDY